MGGRCHEERWWRPRLQADGRNWRVVPVDPAAPLSVDLNAIWAAAPDDAWAVGSTSRGAGPQRVLILHRCAGSPS